MRIGTYSYLKPASVDNIFNALTPSKSLLFRESFKSSFMQYTVPGALLDLTMIGQAALASRNDTRIKKPEWEETYARPGLTWHDEMTEAEALVIADRADRKMRSDMIMSKSDGSLGSTIAILAATFGSQLTDPANWIPLGGLFTKSVRITGGGKSISAGVSLTTRRGTAHTMAPTDKVTDATNLLRTSVWDVGRETGLRLALTEIGRESIFYGRDKAHNEEYDVKQGIINVGLAMGIGTGMGAALQKVRTMSMEKHFTNLLRAQDEIWADVHGTGTASHNSFDPDVPTSSTAARRTPQEEADAATATHQQHAADVPEQTREAAKSASETKAKVLNFLEKCFARMKGAK